MKKLIFLLINTLFPLFIYSQENIISDGTEKEFIVLAITGNSNYSIAPLIISTTKIESIKYDTTVYDQNVKFWGFKNIIISKYSFNKLLLYLNIFETPKVRPKTFLLNSNFSLIIDYRDSSNIDYELLSLQNLSTSIFVIRNIYCFLIANQFDYNLSEYIKQLYKELLIRDKEESLKQGIDCQ